MQTGFHKKTRAIAVSLIALLALGEPFVDKSAQLFANEPSSLRQPIYFKASNAGRRDFFGNEVAIDGDTMVVGALWEDSAVTGIDSNQFADLNEDFNSGAVYVFEREGDSWVQSAYIKASNTDPGDEFGSSVAIDGDTIVVGAAYEDSSSTGINGVENADQSRNYDSGAAYVFVRTGDTWSQEAYLKASNTGEGDRFGFSVDISGNLIVIGADNEDSDATGVNGDQTNSDELNSGAAYVFERNESGWEQEAYLKSANTQSGGFYGATVAIDGDTIVAGAPGEDNLTGAAYIFSRVDETWSAPAKLEASNAAIDDTFGLAVDISGDTIVVGAIFEDSAATGTDGDQFDNSTLNAGAAYVFNRSEGIWNQQAYLKASNAHQVSDYFGWSVAVDGGRIIVGSKQGGGQASGVDGDEGESPDPLYDAGAAYTFVRKNNAWFPQAYVKASNPGMNDSFGFSVAVNGDLVAVSGYSEDSESAGIGGNQHNVNDEEFSSGAVYLFQADGVFKNGSALAMTGSWYNPGSSGEGLMIHAVSDTSAVAYFYGYDDSGNRLWLIATSSGPIAWDQLIEFEVFTASGGVFEGFDPEQIVEGSWGSMMLTMTDCQNASVELSGADGDKTLSLVRLGSVAGSPCFGSDGPGVLNGITGSWFDPQKAGQGFAIHRISSDRGVMYFYGFDSSGSNLWLIGTWETEPEFGTAFEVELYRVSGGTWSEVDPVTINEEVWGTASLQFEDCENGSGTISGLDGVQSLQITLLAGSFGLQCSSD